ncbi:Transposase [Salmonella enterica subsp. enterica]|nr:Transposase [Salmonella enterica subsp. enterica] [Salmonella enterica subsp. enterica serovar Menston]
MEGLKNYVWRYLFVQRNIAERKNRKCWVRYYISSADLTAEKFANAMRSHWDVENKLHWRLDVAMNEDDCRIRRENVKSFFEIIKSGEYEIWGCEIMRWIRINILKCTLVFCLACGFSFAKTPCTNMSDKLSAAQRDSLQNNIKRQLKNRTIKYT